MHDVTALLLLSEAIKQCQPAAAAQLVVAIAAAIMPPLPVLISLLSITPASAKFWNVISI
jgi:hypothetical protein